MDHSAVPTSAAEAGRTGVLETPGTEAAHTGIPAALPDKTALSSPRESSDTIVMADKNMDPDQQVPRQETWDSIQSSSSIQSSLARAGTGFSQSSYSTEHTELDNATSHDDAEEHQHTSAFALRCRSCTSTFHSSTSSRTPSFPPPDRDDMQTPNHPDMIPEGDMPFSLRRGSWQARFNRAPTHPGPHPLSISTPALDIDEMDAEPSNSHDSLDPTPIQTRAPGNQLMGDRDAVPEDDDEWTTAELSPSHMSDSSDALDDTDAVPQQPDERLTQDVCDGLLKHLFGVELLDLASADAALVQNSVRYCMQELFRVVPASLASFPPINQATGYGESSRASAPASNGDVSSINNGQGLNRPGGKRPANHQHPDDDGSNDPRRPGEPKKPKLELAQSSQLEDKRFSCPYRKRNPVRFNVRDHQNCAVQSFPDISQLKRHVKIFHKLTPLPRSACPRCKQDFSTYEELQNHLATPNDQICNFQTVLLSEDPEDGIDAKVEDMLNGRRANSKVDSWEFLWRTLFPDDHSKDIPNPVFEPPIELDEVLAEFQQDRCYDQLRSLIFEEERRAVASDYDVATHAEAVVAICQGHISSIFTTYRRNKIDNTQAKERRKRAQKKNNAQEPSDGNHLTVTPPSHHGYAGDSNGGSPASLGSMGNLGWSVIPQGLTSGSGMQMVTGAYSEIQNPSIQGPVTIRNQPMSDPGPGQQRHHYRGSSGDSAIHFGQAMSTRPAVYAGTPMAVPTSQFPAVYHQPPAIGAPNGFPASAALQAMTAVHAGQTLAGHSNLQFAQQMDNNTYHGFPPQGMENSMEN